ncbi:MAG: hypothetical protein OGM67_08140 [Oscillospiraceae bacterium]|nr:MAG: hypothetical protein OGM67_08140 [Oscillospiraceae bacterium]
MKLRKNIDYGRLLQAIGQCSGNVMLVTTDGDCLNLKSTLSQFIFAAAVSGQVQLQDAALQIESKTDEAILLPFLCEE